VRKSKFEAFGEWIVIAKLEFMQESSEYAFISYFYEKYTVIFRLKKELVEDK